MKKLLLCIGLFLFPLHFLFASNTEVEKLQWHLDRVEGILRKVETPTLTEEQKLNRIKMLDLLHSYTQIGKFPNNDTFPGQYVPFFRGSNGNLCAVGYLMDSDPEYQSYVDTVVKTNNNVRIMDIQNDPTLNTWAKKYGFTILELAMIQPTYYCGMGSNSRLEVFLECSSWYVISFVFFILSIGILIFSYLAHGNLKKYFKYLSIILLVISIILCIFSYIRDALM